MDEDMEEIDRRDGDRKADRGGKARWRAGDRKERYSREVDNRARDMKAGDRRD
jgi:hypothetical protein